MKTLIFLTAFLMLSSITTQAQNCKALFTFNKIESVVAIPEFVNYQFTDQSQGNILKWFWDFGDGSSSYDRNPIHSFPIQGTIFIIKHTISTSDGCISTYADTVKINNIIVPPPTFCNAMFYFYRDSVNMSPVANMFRFVDQSTGNITNWNWNFGDGQSSTVQNPSHVFANSVTGNYDICLKISGANNCASSFCLPLYLNPPVQPCQAMFISYVNDSIVHPDNGLNISFNDMSKGNVIKWLWTFGDGSTSNIKNPSHFYLLTSTDVFQATLTIFTSDSCSSTIKLPVSVQKPPACQADFNVTRNNSPTATNVPAFAFTDISKGNIIQHTWDFGDGTTSFEINPVHIFIGAAKVYNVCLKIATSDNCSSYICKSILVQDTVVGPPVSVCKANFRVMLNANVNSNPTLVPFIFEDLTAGKPTSWFWSFGDGDTSSVQNPQHSFPFTNGFYEACLTVTMPQNCMSTSCMRIYFSTDSLKYNPATGQWEKMVSAGNSKISWSGQIKLFPNPVSKNVNIDLGNSAQTVEYVLCNSVGQTIQKSNKQNYGGAFNFDVGYLKSGMYLVKIIVNGNYNQTVKFFKE